MPLINRIGGSPPTPLNLFVQPDEPTKKDGVWIKAPERHQVRQVVTKDVFSIGGTIRSSSNISSTFHISTGVTVGNAYYFMSDSGSGNLYCYHADTNAIDIATTFEIIGYGWGSVEACYYNGNIYILICNMEHTPKTNVLVTYDIATNSHTTNTLSITGWELVSYYNFSPVLDHYIYLVRDKYTWTDSNNTLNLELDIYKLDVLTNSLFLLKTYFTSYNSSSQIYNTLGLCYDSGYIYIHYYLGGKDTTHVGHVIESFIKIDTITGNVTNLYSLPVHSTIYGYYYNVLVYKGLLFLFSSNPARVIVVYNAETGHLIKQFNDMPDLCSFVDTLFLPNFIVFGNYAPKTVFDIESESLPENTLAIRSGFSHSSDLIKTNKMQIKSAFSDIWWYGTEFHEYPTYIGNSTGWIKIKN